MKMKMKMMKVKKTAFAFFYSFSKTFALITALATSFKLLQP